MSEQVKESVEEPAAVSDIPAAQAETYDELPEGFPVELGNGVTIHVPPQVQWRASALDAMRAGDFQTWAEKVLVGESFEAWEEWYEGDDPTLGEVTEFFDRLGKVTGASAAPNRAARRSSQRTPRR